MPTAKPIVVLLCGLTLATAACSSDDGGEASEASTDEDAGPVTELRPVRVSGPVTGGAEQANAAIQDLDAEGYVEEEFFIDGTATSYTVEGARTSDGMWTAAADDTAPYRTRIIVRRPKDPDSFSGVVVVEWLNVTGGGDGDPDWGYLHEELLREGHAWIGVSAQQTGVSGGAVPVGGIAEGGLVGSDPERYGSLNHPGDRFSFDIFTAAGNAVRNGEGPDPLGGLEPTHVIATGESQSAFFLTSYVNAVHPLTGVYDGFFVHSRGGGAPDPEGQNSLAGFSDDPVRIRTDLEDPVLVFETETDVARLGYFSARQDDTESVRAWEVAGTAHADAYLLEDVYGVSPGDSSGILNCAAPINDGPQHEVLQAGFHHLVGWVEDGTLPPAAPRLSITGGDEPLVNRDEHGNALGGIRTPLVDVPIATLSGEPVPGGSGFCGLFGSTTPFDRATLAELYPTNADYVDAFTAAADDAVEAGFLLRVDADGMIADAETVDLAGGRASAATMTAWTSGPTYRSWTSAATRTHGRT